MAVSTFSALPCPMQDFISTTPIAGLSFPSELRQQMASMASGINKGKVGEIFQSLGRHFANQHLESGQGFPIPSSWTDSLPKVARVTQAPNIPPGQPGLQFERQLDPAGEEFWRGMNEVMRSMGKDLKHAAEVCDKSAEVWEKLRSLVEFLSDAARMAWQECCNWCQEVLDWLKSESAYSFFQWTVTLSTSALAGMVGGYMARYMMKWTCQRVGLSESLVGDLTTWFAGQLGAMLAGALCGGAVGENMPAVGLLWGAFSGSLAGLIAYNIQSAGGNIDDLKYLKNVCIQCVGTGYKFKLQAGESFSEAGSSIGSIAGGGLSFVVCRFPVYREVGWIVSLAYGGTPWTWGHAIGGHVGSGVGDVAGRVLGARLRDGPCTSCGGQGHTNF